MARIKKILGVFLAMWGAIRGGVDLLESLKATREYAVAIYAHRYLAIGLSRSTSLTVVVFVVGGGLIFSDQITKRVKLIFGKEPSTHVAPVIPAATSEPNITWDTVSFQKLVFENGKFRRLAPYESAPWLFGWFFVVTNLACKERKVGSAGEVRANFVFRLKQGEYQISPGAWVDEPYSSVRLDVGDTRQLIIATSESFNSGWKMVANRRGSEGGVISMDYSRDFPMNAEGTLEVNLVAVQSGSIIKTWSASINCRDYTLKVHGVKES